jgi:hypothetical protein
MSPRSRHSSKRINATIPRSSCRSASPPLGELSLFTTLTTFGTPLDVTIDELAIELFFPADNRSDEMLHQMALARRVIDPGLIEQSDRIAHSSRWRSRAIHGTEIAPQHDRNIPPARNTSREP